jgi:tetratricopeptide (TPR) repeat protein
MTSQDLDQSKKKAEFDRLMTAATVYRRRGDYAQATQTVKQALTILPDNIDGREFAADMIYAHGDVQKASEHYKAILEIEPGRASAEAKYAKAILELAEAQRQQDLIKYMLENPGKSQTMQHRNPAVAAMLSIAPGFGHIYCGLYVMGMALFCGWVFAWLLFFWTLGDSVGGQITQKLTASSTAFACIAAALHIYALVNAAQQAEKVNSGKNGKSLSEPE